MYYLGVVVLVEANRDGHAKVDGVCISNSLVSRQLRLTWKQAVTLSLKLDLGQNFDHCVIKVNLKQGMRFLVVVVESQV